MIKPKVGDLVSCIRHLSCGRAILDGLGNSVRIARPTELGIITYGYSLVQGTYGLVVRDYTGASNLLGVLIGDELFAMFPDHVRVIQHVGSHDASR